MNVYSCLVVCFVAWCCTKVVLKVCNVLFKLFMKVFSLVDFAVTDVSCYKPRYAWLVPFTNYFLEVRLTMIKHGLYPTPKAPAWRSVVRDEQGRKKLKCSKCSGRNNQATIWCVDCKARFCGACAARNHHPGLLAKYHSLEEIKQEQLSVIGPLLSNIFLAFAAFYICWNLNVAEDYLYSADICPVVSQARSLAARIDAKVYYHYKADLNKYCNTEDSFYRLFLDGWVRGVVTDSDDTLLVLQQFMTAHLYMSVVSLIAIPALGVAYAGLMALARYLDGFLPPDIMARAQELAKWDVASLLGDQSSTPPLTLKRRRSDADVWEGFKYRQERKWRAYAFFKATAKDSLTYWANRIVPYVAGFRLCLIWFPGGHLSSFLRNALSIVGFRSVLCKQQALFQDTVDKMLFGDVFAQRLLAAGVSFIGISPTVSDAVFKYVPLVMLIMLVSYLSFLWYITTQSMKLYGASVTGAKGSVWKEEEPVLLGCCDAQSCACEAVKHFQQTWSSQD
eukprot:TRINITY_DN43493_c0_g1_i1.p1 TRINITY_DN43493_c0_g1~~TRINITY_DN43493_c0_g1_i1.p1  ORF type:complete len:538 (-),score=92.37 TRINITY_DN43493_c0_g1_i1:211-1728(-)